MLALTKFPECAQTGVGQRYPRFERHRKDIHLFTEGRSESPFRVATASAGSPKQDRNVQRVSAKVTTLSIKSGNLNRGGENFTVTFIKFLERWAT